jgi:hypothetical protein
MLLITFPVTVMDVGTPVDELESLLHPGKVARRNAPVPRTERRTAGRVWGIIDLKSTGISGDRAVRIDRHVKE